MDGAVFEKSGTMSGGGGKPRGGRMGTAIRACSVSTEAIAKAEDDLTTCMERGRDLREKINAATHQYRSAEKVLTQLELQLAKIRMEVCALLIGTALIMTRKPIYTVSHRSIWVLI